MRKKTDPKAQEAVASSTGGIPTSEGLPITTQQPLTPVQKPVVSDTGIKYIASSALFPYYAGDRALPTTIDEAERKYGHDLYEKKMLGEPVLAGIERVLKILVLADGMTVTASHKKPKTGSASAQELLDWDLSQKIADYVRIAVERMEDTDQDIMSLAWNLMDAPRLGHKLAEVNFDHLPSGEFKGKVGIESIRCKPRENYAFVLDQNNTFRGVIGKMPGGSIALWQGFIVDLSQLKNAIAPEKLLIFTPDMRDGNPQGVSWFQSVYDPYYRKQILKPEEIKTGVQFGGGMISVTAPEEKANETIIDPYTGKKIRLMEAIANAVKQMRNGSGGVFPAGTVVDIHQPSADPAFFDVAFSRYDREMVQAFLLSARSILEAKHGSKADSDSASDLVDELKMFMRHRLCLMLKRLFKRLVMMSFGPEIAQKFTPVATMQRASRPDFAVNAMAVASLWQSQYLDDSQRAEIDVEILGISEREQSDNAEAEDETDPPTGTEQDPSEAAPAKKEEADSKKSAKFQERPVLASAKGLRGRGYVTKGTDSQAGGRRDSNGRGLLEVDEQRAQQIARTQRSIGSWRDRRRNLGR